MTRTAITIAILLGVAGCSPTSERCFQAALHSPANSRMYEEAGHDWARQSLKLSEYAKTVKDPCMKSGFEQVAASTAWLAENAKGDAMETARAEHDGGAYK